MAISWGAWRNGGYLNGFRLGYEYSQSPSSVGSGTSSVTVTLKLYVETKRSVSDSTNSWSLSGNFSGSGSVSINNGDGGGVDLITTKTRTVSTSYNGSVKSSFSASLSGINAISGTASVSGNFYTAERPITAPYTPTGINITRNSDTSHTVKWTNTSPTTAGRPYQQVEVQRWDRVSNVWSTMATLSGYPSSYTNTSTKTNNQYRWRVRAKNSAGSTGYIYSGYWATKQAPPSTPSASKISNDIKLTWNNNAANKITGIEVWHASDGVWEGSVMAYLSGAPTTYTHNNPDPTKTHTYKLKTQAGADDDAPNLYSDFSGQSNTIQLLTSPAAPTKLSPASKTFDATNAQVVSWQHNAVDTTAQTNYEIQTRVDGGSWFSTGKIASSNSTRTFAANTFENGKSVEWQVRTWGDYFYTSPWSATALLTTSAVPTVNISFPDTLIVVDTSKINATWSYYDEEGSVQAQARVKLYSAGGASVLLDKVISGTASTLALNYTLRNNTGYRVGVSVQDGSGLWSVESTEDFTVAYALPATPELVISWDGTRGATAVDISNPVAGPGEADTVYSELWRSVDWMTYELVAGDIPPNTTITDYIPAIGGTNIYLVLSYSAIGAAAQSVPVIFEAPVDSSWFWLNGGAAFSELCRIRYNPSESRTFSRDKTLNSFAGRQFPVETAGEHLSREIDLSASVFGDDDTDLDALEEITKNAAPACYRTPGGHRRFVSIGNVSGSGSGSGESVGVKLTQIDDPNTRTMALEPVVFRTNHATMPIANGTGFAGHNSGTGGSYTISWMTEQEDGPTGKITAYGRALTVASATSSSGGWLSYSDSTKRVPLVGETGDVITISMYARYTGDAPSASRTFRVYLYNGTTLVQNTNVTVTRMSGQWVRLSQTITALGPYTTISWWDYFTGGDPAPAGSTFDIAGLLVTRGNELEDYFDGDGWDGDTVLTARWTGVVNASTSELTRGGQE